MKSPAWLQVLLAQEKITDILLNGPHEVFIDQGNGMEPYLFENEDTWNESEFKLWIIDSLSQAGKSWDAKFPFVDAMIDASLRMHVIFPPISPKGILVSLRRLPQNRCQKKTYWTDSHRFAFILEKITLGESLLVSGATGSGKTTLINELISLLPKNERIVALEDTPELHPTHPHFISLLSRPPNSDGFGEITLRDLLKQSLRMRPDRIVLGECRGAEVLDLLQLLNTGHKGTLATIHANSERDALRRIELLCLLATGGTLSLTVIRELICVGLHWIIQIGRTPVGRKILGISKINGKEGDTILLRPINSQNLFKMSRLDSAQL